MNIKSSVLETVGATPLVEAQSSSNAGSRILLKIESFNPSASVKDRAALYMVNAAEKDGLLKKGGVIIEPTSGNTGIGLAMVAAVRGYKLILTMPETMSVERRKILKAYGAEIVLTEGAKGMQGSIDAAENLKKTKYPDAFIPQQFENPANAQAHFETTGPEIWRDTDGQVDAFVAGVGTGGTLSGTARFLKSKNPKICIVGVEPSDSPILSGGKAAPHKLQGIGANFVPKLYDKSLVDEIIKVDAPDAGKAARLLAAKDGALVGISAGAAYAAAQELASRPEFKGKNIVCLIPDTGMRYLSTWLFDE